MHGHAGELVLLVAAAQKFANAQTISSMLNARSASSATSAGISMLPKCRIKFNEDVCLLTHWRFETNQPEQSTYTLLHKLLPYAYYFYFIIHLLQ